MGKYSLMSYGPVHLEMPKARNPVGPGGRHTQPPASPVGSPGMRRDDPRFPDLVLGELAKRLVEDPDPADRLPGMPEDALRATCAIDALADHLRIELTDDQVTAQLPGDDPDQRQKIRERLEALGKADEMVVFARREAALAWLVNNSSITYK